MMKLVNDKGRLILNSGDIKISVGGSLPSNRSTELGATKPAEAILMVE